MQWWRAALAALSLSALAGVGVGAGSGASAQLERQLLQLLGLKQRPRIDPGRAAIPDAMRALYRHFAAGALFLNHKQRVANTVRSFTHQESAIDDRFKGHHRFRLRFNVSVPDEETLNAAELVLSRDSVRFPPDLKSDQRHKVLVYDIVKPGVKGQSRPTLRLLDSKWVRGERAGAVRLDVSGAAERWMWRPADNHGLLVEVTAPQGADRARQHVRLRRSPTDSRESWRARQPVLLAFTDDHRSRALKPTPESERATRTTRAATRPHRRKKGQDMCKRRPLYVDFQEVGWNDWIVAPPGYEAYYCKGECPFPLGEHLNSTNHAIVQTLVNSVNPMAVPMACCVPTDLTYISMLYMDEEHKVVLKNYHDMTVIGCGCR